MAHPVQNINHSAFRSMFERGKLSRNNFNDWFRQLKLVLRVKKKMFVIEQPIPPAHPADSAANVPAEWKAIYDAYNEVACLMLGSMNLEFHRQFENYSPYEMLQELKSMFEKQVGMKGYVDQLERLGYVLPQDLTVGLILNSLTKDFSGFVRNYNMHNMGKTIGELHAMLIEYEKPKNPKPSAKEHPAKDDTCHHYKEVVHGKRNCLVYLVELLKKKKQVGTVSSSGIFTIELFAFPNKSWVYDNSCGTHICITKQGFREAKKLKQGALYFNDIYDIDKHDLVPNVNFIYNVSTKRAKHNLDSTYLWHCRLAPISRKRIEKLRQEGLLKSTDDESFDQCVPCLSGKMTRKSFLHRPERATDLLGIIHNDVFKNEVKNQLEKLIKALRSDRGGKYISQEFKDYLKVCGIIQQLTPPYTPQHNDDYSLESATRILNMVPTKKVDKTPYELWYAEFFEKNLLTQEVSGRAIDLEEIQDEDTSPSKITIKIPIEVEVFEPPQEEVIPIHRSERTHQAPNRLCLNVEVEEHSLGDLNEPTSYKASILQSVKDYLGKCFAMKDLREATFILGVKIFRDRSKRLIRLGQNAYMDKILKRYKMDNFKRGHILMQERLDLNKTQRASTPKEVKRMQNVPYALIVGFIIDDTKSQTRYVFILNGGAVDWKSSKQSTTAMSATEAEYIAASEAV
uniref:GAG-pre-integrase domain-containing protein n=1 Tax=Tanacetum cinerariifolium TaxID=118510 RepID=A0A6L2MMI1_TANCI|nr:hypothetical protein [Tanacetum cinerariifolium]